MEDLIQSTWNSLIPETRVGSYLSDDLLAALRYRYSDDSRHYHNETHINCMLMHLGNMGITDPSVLWATLYHDSIQGVEDSELKSANYSRMVLESLGVPQSIAYRAFILITCTKDHTLPSMYHNDECAKAFLDADLSILGSDPDTYWFYQDNIRKEYNHLSTVEYTAGRVAVLNKFRSTAPLYKTKYFADLFEDQARTNIIEELGEHIF